MFSNGLKYVITCQSRFCRKSVNEIITEQYQNISTTIKSCLKDNRILITDERAKQAFSTLERIFYKNFNQSNYQKKLTIRAQCEYKIVQSIQRLIRQRSDIVVGRTDKIKVFYIGKAADFARKAEEYMLKTEAYREFTNGRCPLANNLSTVQT